MAGESKPEEAASAAAASAPTIALAGRRVPRIGTGTMALAIEGRPTLGGAAVPDRAVAIAALHAALDAGVRYLDTAWSYYLPTRAPFGAPEDFGYGERLTAEALATWDGPRDEVLVATKTGFLRTLDVSGTVTLSAYGDGPAAAETLRRPVYQAPGSRYGWAPDGRPATIARDARESATRLGLGDEPIDLLYSHGPDPAVPYEDQMGAFRALVDQGIVRSVGVSRVNVAQIDVARSILGDALVAVQNQFSPSHPDTDGTLDRCRELGLAFVAFSPLGGFLDPVDAKAYDRFRAIGAQLGCSYQRAVLTWELAQYDRLIAIPSARNPYEARDSFAATTLMLPDTAVR
ncbi:oxidoreductase, aldo/keto reductase family protein [Bifidobacterium sp. DSM 109958]|uniref:Oxidoreductase, aldo/keto reductase family protein n=1 Tax=Bifidobacterium moraviense TaxID=2675323 RepID=A0A7Y0F292_9BIFI|nr:oxidoreductase, aldo/keto reductase family protein [Bifidobacterium sp. DSM 109958]